MHSTLRRAAVAIVAAGALLVGAAPAWGSYGVSSFEVQMRNQSGSVDTQAGSHPYEVTTSYSLSTVTTPQGVVPDENQRNETIDLPAGFVGNPAAIPTCPRDKVGLGECPAASQVGFVTLNVADPIMSLLFGSKLTTGVYNVVPRRGEAADLAFQVMTAPVHMEVGLRSEGDYGVRVKLTNVPDSVPFSAVKLTLWGAPGAASHTADRGSDFNCYGEPGEPGACSGGGEGAGGEPAAFLSMPTSCGTPLVSTITTDSWQRPGSYVTAKYVAPALTGCDAMRFAPSVRVSASDATAGAPTGLQMAITLPQSEGSSEYATPGLKQAKIVLPEGMAISPSSAAGLAACADAELGIGTSGPASCPADSRVGEVSISTPLLNEPLRGGVFVGTPLPGNPYRLFLVAEDPKRGVLVRLQASVLADPSTGRLTVEVAEAPQLPTSEMTVSLEGGPQALLREPTTCGAATTTADLTPWGAPETPAAAVSSSYPVTGACGSRPFAPGLVAGSVDPRAGGSSPFAFTLTRQDGEQQLGALSLRLPPGLTARLQSVAECPEQQAAAGDCGSGSEIGTAVVAAGAGAAPLWIRDGRVYLTGPYKGAPFGLAIVVPAVAGPFHLGTVVVRAAMSVDPLTAQVTVSTDPLPWILEGVPIELRSVAVTINRPNFMVNPTSCAAAAVQGRTISRSGTVDEDAERFDAVGCASLAFKPRLTALTLAHATRNGGASLHVVVRAKPGEANIKRVAVRMPMRLVARSSTLKQACEEAVFAKAPSSCPAASRIGTATVYTPVLGVPLSGDVYYVSRADLGYPEVVAVLKGDGVVIELRGATHINSATNATRVVFGRLPDVPISRFDLVLPRGPHSALSAVGRLCGRPLRMPTKITGQNGMVLRHVTKVMVSGCGAPRDHAKKRSPRRTKKRSGR